jgi:hypothetical protein
MTRTEQKLVAARTRRDAGREGESRRFAQAADARRRLNAVRAPGAPTKADRHDPRDPRLAYLTQSHD